MKTTMKHSSNRSVELHRLLTQVGPQAMAPRAAIAPARIETHEEKVITTCKIAGKPELAAKFLSAGVDYPEILKQLMPESGPQMLTRLAKERFSGRWR